MIHLTAVLDFIAGNWTSLLGAVVASFIVGFLWHGPLFGKIWMKYNKLEAPKNGEATFSMMIPGICASVVMAFVQASVMGRTFEIVVMDNISQALMIAVLLWFPFTALTIVNSYAWLGRKVGHMVLDSAYNLASMCAIAAVMYGTM